MKHFRIKVLIAIIWLVFTVSLAGWWLIHAWDQIEITSQGNARSMLKWEGVSLLFALLAGGAAIFYLIYQERSSYRTLNDFHMAFSHDLKNAMTSLQMQVGALQDEQQGKQNPILMRLDQDSRRLKMKLENSLELYKSNAATLHMQNTSISDILVRIRFHGKRDQLSKMYYSSNPPGGSGIGLFLVEKLTKKMKGKVSFPLPKTDEGFVVLLTLLEARY